MVNVRMKHTKYNQRGILNMMYIHYCGNCRRIHILNGHRTLCPTCDFKLSELHITYMEYIEMNQEERKSLLTKLSDLTVF